VSDFDGRIWLVQDNDSLMLVCVHKIAKKKVQALNEKGRELSLAEDKLFWQHPAQVRSAQEWPALVERIQQNLALLRDDIDLPLLWETAQDLGSSDIAELADLYFGGEITVEHRVALWQALALDGLYFKRRGKVWELRSAAQVEELRTQRLREHHKANTQTLASDWLKAAAVSPKTLLVDEAIAPFVERLECWLHGDKDKDAETLIHEVADSSSLSPRELVFEVLQKAGRIPADADRDVIVAGLKPEFSAPVQEAALAIAAWLPDPAQTIHSLAFSIDDDDTREVDDALHIERLTDGWRVWIGISDPACLLSKGDVLDREAMRRGTTVYLPTQTVLMLPEAVSCDLASLSVGVVRSSVVIEVNLDFQGQVQDSRISRAAVQVEQRLSYQEADALIADGHTDCALRLREFVQLAALRRQQRQTEGALSFSRPEYKIKVQDGQIDVTLIDRDSPSRALVAECMILANHLAGKYAQSHQVPIIFRTQEAPQEPIPLALQSDPVAFSRLRKLIKPSALSLAPGAHSGLGLSVYTQFSSPLRRFADLVMQRQLDAHLNGDTLPYTQEELFQVLATAEHTARESRTVENEAKKRWFMFYLKQHWQDKPLPVLILDVLKIGYKVEMQPWGVDAVMNGPGHLQPGQRVMAQIERIRPKAGQARLKYGWLLSE